jgi:hypothetical protein
MARTIVIPADLEYPGVTKHKDGTRTIDIDLLFADSLETDEEMEVDGKPYQTISTRFSKLKLAANPRMHRSHFGSGEEIELHDFFLFGGWDGEHFARTVCEGPLVRGPYMYASELGSVITAHKEPDEHAILVNDGDTLIFMGHKFRATITAKQVYPRGKFNLELLAS